MKEVINFDERKPIWIALSDLYLDTELKQDFHLKYIATTISQSSYTFDEVKKINKYEVFPVLFSNLLQPAGEWFAFDERIIINSIIEWIESKKPLDLLAVEWVYMVYKDINEEYWDEIEYLYNKIRSSSLSDS
ncbi:MAG TPA: hypothetical protein DIW37_01805 [Chryseobacterium sp.]|nr:hypothetical protein [Chryseobacterium sp.]